MPRLELMGLVKGVRATQFVIKELKIEHIPVTIWSDSKCVLHWIQANESKNLPRFVKNRVNEIKGMKATYKYVSTTDNPADIGTRGSTVKQLQTNQIWWNGPEWLKKSTDFWPKTPDLKEYIIKDETTNKPENDDQQINLITTTTNNFKTIYKVENFSTWTKLVRTVAFVLIFIRQCKIKNNNKTTEKTNKKGKNFIIPEANIMKLSQQTILKMIQNEFPPTQSEIQQLNIQKDKSEILRCIGRLDKSSNLTSDEKEPIYLSKDAKETHLIILSVHRILLHGGVNLTLNTIRRQFWIPKGRSVIKSCLRKCFTCNNTKSKPFQLPTIANLPKERISVSRPFENIGLDYIGPMIIKIKNDTEKMWICLFTCMTTRNVHLEYVLQLDSMTFLNAIRRFIARRGRPNYFR